MTLLNIRYTNLRQKMSQMSQALQERQGSGQEQAVPFSGFQLE